MKFRDLISTINENVLGDMISEGMAPFTDKQLDTLRKEYGKIKTIDPNSETVKKLEAFLKSLPTANLKQIKDGGIKFLNTKANMILMKRGINESETLEESDISSAVDGLLAGFRKAFEIALLMYEKDVESGKITGNDAINKAMIKVASEFQKHGMSKKDAELFVKVAGAQSLQDNGLKLPEKFLKQLLKEIGK